ncbi:uncharacterized protein LOC105701647 isoform X2 [Orussus abietinus]|nr:uncharacterized protein LOC105701647 isoform X2 [Orussus abietinus]XP_023288121.1 uncharacterized protein LOC105701647 isoform X2 [Orussus abietinus]
MSIDTRRYQENRWEKQDNAGYQRVLSHDYHKRRSVHNSAMTPSPFISFASFLLIVLLLGNDVLAAKEDKTQEDIRHLVRGNDDLDFTDNRDLNAAVIGATLYRDNNDLYNDDEVVALAEGNDIRQEQSLDVDFWWKIRRRKRSAIEPLPSHDGKEAVAKSSGTIDEANPSISTAEVPKKLQDTPKFSEPNDMLQTHVTPHDDDDEPLKVPDDKLQAENVSQMPENVSLPVKVKQTDEEALYIATLPPKIFPYDGNIKSFDEASKGIRDKLSSTMYETIPQGKAETIDSINTNSSSTTVPEPVTTLLTVLFKSTTPSYLKNDKSTEAVNMTGHAIQTMEQNKTGGKGMPSGMIALVIAVTFAAIVVIGYVGLIAWKRYQEFRVDNRELLVNELEFDTNDLRHFEL